MFSSPFADFHQISYFFSNRALIHNFSRFFQTDAHPVCQLVILCLAAFAFYVSL